MGLTHSRSERLLIQHASHKVDENVTFAQSQSFSTLLDFFFLSLIRVCCLMAL
jgi:hypothetical protein